MNFTVTPQAKRKLYLLLITTLLLVDIGVIMLFKFNWRESALLLIATPTLLNLFLKFVMPLLQQKAADIKDDLITADKHKQTQIEIASNEGKKPFEVGPGKNHVVYASNFFIAQKVYEKKIAALLKNNPKKKFYYVTEKYNNL